MAARLPGFCSGLDSLPRTVRAPQFPSRSLQVPAPCLCVLLVVRSVLLSPPCGTPPLPRRHRGSSIPWPRLSGFVVFITLEGCLSSFLLAVRPRQVPASLKLLHFLQLSVACLFPPTGEYFVVVFPSSVVSDSLRPPRTAARQAPLSFTVCWSLLKHMNIWCFSNCILPNIQFDLRCFSCVFFAHSSHDCIFL